MPTKFSPQAIRVMRALVESDPMDLRRLGRAKIRALLKMDTANEVLICHKGGKVALTAKAFQPILDMVRGVFVEGEMTQAPDLRLVYSAKGGNPQNSDPEDGESKELPKGEESK